METRKGLVLNVGTSSVLLILLVFVLSVFALLSIRASGNEENLATKTGVSVAEYYKADQKAEHTLMYVDAILQSSELEQLEENFIGLQAKNAPEIEGLENVVFSLDDKQVKLDTDTVKREKKQFGTLSYEYMVREGIYLNVSLELYSNRSYVIKQWSITQTKAGVYDIDDGMELWDGQTE